MIRLTAQQQAVVNHNYGPALVFAVAGAGKTTALEQRIVRLVRERIFAPGRILAAAYNTAVRQELGARLRRHAGCEAVEVTTLHALGLRAVRMAWEAGLLPQLKRNAFQETEQAQETILVAALAEARRLKVSYLRELDTLDRADFFTWLSSCHGNLFYPNLAELPTVLQQTRRAQQAAAPPQTPWYLPFAQLMATVQQARGLLTFDDQLRVGWEVLVSHPTILKQLQQSYDCVLVDEFQDVNLAQYLILDLITAPRSDKPQRNYMVVGDDDQTIYEWRGANPHFILNFGKEYKATSYVMSENFRCPAAPLTLANQVIQNNRQRYAKRLQLTQGFGGVTTVTRSPDRRQMGQAIVANIRNLMAQGDRIDEMAVLVRAKAQTPPVELALIQAQLPYEVVGSQPFYARWEITTLISYCRLGLFEQQLQKGKQLTASELAQLVESWEELYRHPKRYISQGDARQISAELAQARAPITQVLRKVVIADKPHIQARLSELATLLQWLSSAFVGGRTAKSAHAVLQELERKLGYCDYLEKRGTRSESGVDEAENVKQFIEEAKDRGTLTDYLVYLKQLAEQQAAQQAAAGRNRLTIRTIHSAKGLEWPVVIIPSCDEGNFPHRKSDNMEEERRLLYVALTRSRRDLYIYYLNKEPTSFLTQAKWQSALKAVEQIRSALEKSPATWSADEAQAVAVAVPQLGLMSYFQEWRRWPPGEQRAFAEAAEAYLAGVRVSRSWGHLEQLAAQWRQLSVPGAPKPVSQTDALDVGLGEWLGDPPPGEQKSNQAEGARRGAGGKRKTAAATKAAGDHTPQDAAGSAVRRVGQGWQAFDVVHHPHHGQGIVISTTTTTRGRELKVQFANGNLVQFREDDPALARG